jgi:hypothetical protein
MLFLIIFKSTGKRTGENGRTILVRILNSINTRNLVDSAQDRDYLRALVNAVLDLRLPKAMVLVPP